MVPLLLIIILILAVGGGIFVNKLLFLILLAALLLFFLGEYAHAGDRAAAARQRARRRHGRRRAAAQYVVRMGTHVRALGTLIDDLFELTRLQSGELEWTMEQVSVGLLLEEAVDAMRPAAEAGAVSVSARLGSPLGAARANPEQLQRVLFNLIQNAIHHTPADGSVTVSAETVNGGIEVEVADTGDGIPPISVSVRVFDPFFRGDEARHHAGAGLGLAIRARSSINMYLDHRRP